MEKKPRGSAILAHSGNASIQEKIAMEIVHTETFYVSSIEKLISWYLLPIRDVANKGSEGITPADVREIFSNIELIVNVNKEFLKDLKARFTPWTKDTCIGDVFLKFIPFFKIYTDYGSSYDSALAKVNQLMESNKWFNQVITQTNIKMKVESNVNFEGLLIMPVQRIPRYSLLLQDLLKNTPEDHPDHQNLKMQLLRWYSSLF